MRTEDEYRVVFKKNLNRIMKEKGKNQADLIKDLGLTSSTISSWCTGVKLPRMNKIQMLADYFHVSKSELIEDRHAPSPDMINEIPSIRPGAVRKMIPVLGKISAGIPMYAEENVEYYISTDIVGEGDYFALTVRGDSMNAAQICDGNILIVRKQDIVEDNDIAVVLVNGDEATVKRFRKDGQFIMLIPQSTNPAHAPQIYNPAKVPVKVLGKVVKCLVEFE